MAKQKTIVRDRSAGTGRFQRTGTAKRFPGTSIRDVMKRKAK